MPSGAPGAFHGVAARRGAAHLEVCALTICLVVLSAGCGRFVREENVRGWVSCEVFEANGIREALATTGVAKRLVSLDLEGNGYTYALDLHSNGVVKFFGAGGVSCCGVYRRQINASAVWGLLRELRSLKLDPEDASIAADAPVIVLSFISDDGTFKTVQFSQGVGLVEFEDAARRVHHVAGTRQALRLLDEFLLDPSRLAADRDCSGRSL